MRPASSAGFVVQREISRRAAVPKLAAIEGPHRAFIRAQAFPRVDVGANAICLFAFPELHEVHADIAKTADLRPQHLAWIPSPVSEITLNTTSARHRWAAGRS